MTLVILSEDWEPATVGRTKSQGLEMVWVWLRAVDFNYALWSRLGTPQSYRNVTHKDRLKRSLPCFKFFSPLATMKIYESYDFAISAITTSYHSYSSDVTTSGAQVRFGHQDHSARQRHGDCARCQTSGCSWAQGKSGWLFTFCCFFSYPKHEWTCICCDVHMLLRLALRHSHNN